MANEARRTISWIVILVLCLPSSRYLPAQSVVAATPGRSINASAQDGSVQDLQATKSVKEPYDHSRLRQFGGNLFVQGLVYLLLSGTGWFVGSRGVGGPNFPRDMVVVGSISVISVISGGGILLATNRPSSGALLEYKNGELSLGSPDIAFDRRRAIGPIVSLAAAHF